MDVPPDYRISIIINQWNQRLLSNYYFMGRSVLFPRFNQPWRGDLTLRHIHLPVARARHDVHLQYVSNPSSSATTTSARGNVIVSTFPTGSLDSIHPQGPTLLEHASLLPLSCLWRLGDHNRAHSSPFRQWCCPVGGGARGNNITISTQCYYRHCTEDCGRTRVVRTAPICCACQAASLHWSITSPRRRRLVSTQPPYVCL